MTLRTPAAAAEWALAQPRWEHAMCLNFVWRCYDVAGNESSALAAYGFPPPVGRAIDGWTGSPLKHPGDRTPPIGAPVYYTAASSGATAGDGHVAIYVGNGMIRSTDAGGYGINSTVPLDWPERAWGRRYLGWTGDILGHALELAAPASTTATPIQGDEIDMATLEELGKLFDEKLAAVKDGIRRDARARVYKNGTTGEFIAIDWDQEPGSPARILYAHDGERQVRRWYDYQIVGDSPEQARTIAAGDWGTLLDLAHGTDSAFRP